MLIDTKEMFSDAQAITVDAVSTNVIDLLPSGGSINAGDTGGPTANTTVNLGAGHPKYLYILVHTTFAKAGANPTLTASLESDSATGLDSSATVHWTGAAEAEASLVAGYWIAKGIPIPPGAYERYLGVRYTTGTDDFDTGKVSAWLSDTPFNENQYRAGHTTGIN